MFVVVVAATDGAMFRFSTQRGGSTKRTTHSVLFVFILRLRICSSIVTYKADPACMRTSQTLIPASSALNFGLWVSRFLVRDDEKIVDHVCD